MKLGVVAENDRLGDSPDTVAIVEPTIGAVARSKGSLFLIVCGSGKNRKLGEAAQLVADTVQGEYYYDESAGLLVCLEKAVRAANKKLAAARDRLNLGPQGRPIGLGAAVVRSNELYVVTCGPVEAYLVRQAHLLTLPGASRDQGMPMEEVAPEVWRGEMTVGDTLVLVSSNVSGRLGTDEIKNAVVTLHPQSAIEHLHHRFVTAGGSGSDTALAIEATEVSATSRRGKLIPVRPAEPLAGTPDRSPIPLAEAVNDGVTAVSAGAGRARSAAGGFLGGIVTAVQDVMPRRGPGYRRVTPATSRRESQRRAAIAVLAFVVIVGGIAGAMYWLGAFNTGPRPTIPDVTAGDRAVTAAKEDLRLVFDNGSDLVVDSPSRAHDLLSDAWNQIKTAAAAGVPDAALAPLRTETTNGLDRLFQVSEVQAATVFNGAGQQVPFNLTALVRGPDGAPYILDTANKKVYRVDVAGHKVATILASGQSAAGGKVADPKLLAVGGPDLLILDSKNNLWRWRPSDPQGHPGVGTTSKIAVNEAATWGPDILALGTFNRNADQGLYNLYVLDPSEQQILSYSPAYDGSGYLGAGTGWFTTPRPVAAVTCMLIDGDVFLADGTSVQRFVGGDTTGWGTGDPGDELLRPDLQAGRAGHVHGPRRRIALRVRPGERPDPRLSTSRAGTTSPSTGRSPAARAGPGCGSS